MKMRITYTLGTDVKQRRGYAKLNSEAVEFVERRAHTAPLIADVCYCFFWSLAVSTGCSCAFFQLLSGS